MFKVNIARSMTAFFALALLFSFTLPSVASAAGNGLRVSPVRSDATIDVGKTKTVNITVTNITTESADFMAIINDFTASADESGQPAIILNPDQFAANHSLKRYIKDIPSFTLAAGQQKIVPVLITIPANAAGGGYYGAVRFAPTAADGDNRTVTLAGSVGSLILVKVPGDIKSQMSIVSFDAREGDTAKSLFFNHTKISSVVRFQNQGNIQEQPFGKVLLKNRSGKVLAQYEVNNADSRGNVLPDSIRKFNTKLDKVGSFGMFKLEGNFGYGTTGQLMSASTTFYVVPTSFILVFVGLILLVLFLVFVLPRLIRLYNQRVISQANKLK